MSKFDITAMLTDRINESIKWAEMNFPGDMDDVKVRAYGCSAKAIKLLDDPGRKEQYGVRFRMSWESDKQYYSDVDVRIEPKGYKGENGPYVVVYILTNENVGDEIHHATVTKKYIDVYGIGSDIPIQKFYHHWLSILKRDEYDRKIFMYKKSFSKN